jgi:thiamine pyrophosphate-dependent acetolactate synthase large subunit-like protein
LDKILQAQPAAWFSRAGRGECAAACKYFAAAVGRARSRAADLRPQTRYDEVVTALGGHGELVSAPDELRPALVRAFESGKPALVNVLTDPSVQYPRSANLA